MMMYFNQLLTRDVLESHPKKGLTNIFFYLYMYHLDIYL